tara:strand:- start:180 stop:434 length:255 start_codon:yes stop_codon:yes gene_type:complete
VLLSAKSSDNLLHSNILITKGLSIQGSGDVTSSTDMRMDLKNVSDARSAQQHAHQTVFELLLMKMIRKIGVLQENDTHVSTKLT